MKEFKFRLSISTAEVKSKEEGRFATEFEVKEFTSKDEDEIRRIITSRNYSTNVWEQISNTEDYDGMTGVTLDFDKGLTIDDAKERFKDYNYILHTSASHRVKEPVADRFRIILPFEANDLRFTTQKECRKVYHKFMSENPEADPYCGNPARKFFPHTDENKAELIFSVNRTGKYFNIDVSDIKDEDLFLPEDRNYQPPDELNTREELARMLKFDPFMTWCKEQADKGIPEPLWYAMISNLCRFEGGRELIHEISARDPDSGRYDPDETDAKIDRAFNNSGPIGYKKIVSEGWQGKAPKRPVSPAGFGTIARRSPLKDEKAQVWIGFKDDTVAKQYNQWEVVQFGELKKQMKAMKAQFQVVCPFCDNENAETGIDTFGFAYTWCDRCNRRFYEFPLTSNMFTYKNKLLRVEKRSGKFISMEMLDEDSFRTKSDFKFVKKKLLTDENRRFLDDNFQIQRRGSAEYQNLEYEFDMKENALVYRYPALPIEVEDNAFVDKFIDGLFGLHSNFIRNWMALYSYTNYVTLPVIVLTGERSCGKGTFANMVGEIFPSLMALWDGGKEHFNDQYKSKLLFVDENPNAEKPVQYTEIKKITGNKILRINEKYTPAYNVPNNINIIIATNDPRPMFLKSKEEPKSENTNNFFIYRLPGLDPSEVNDQLGEQLRERLGYYVRTELKKRYEILIAKKSTNNRYSLPAPITTLTRDLFAGSKSTVELEAGELAQYIVCGVNMPDPYGNEYSPPIEFRGYISGCDNYIKLEEFRKLVQRLRLKESRNYKSYLNILQDQHVLAYDETRTNANRFGYAILRDPTYYTTVSGQIVTQVTETDIYNIDSVTKSNSQKTES